MGSKTTVYLDPKIYKAVKAKAAHTDHSLSYVVNEALRLSLKEDALDYDVFENVKKNQRVVWDRF